eukprot:SAG31_NODE_2788_length_5089_cov_7.201002_5_plen_178_part_00
MHQLPTSLWCGYSNGGEFRKSYHGLPPPFVQVIESPRKRARSIRYYLFMYSARFRYSCLHSLNLRPHPYRYSPIIILKPRSHSGLRWERLHRCVRYDADADRHLEQRQDEPHWRTLRPWPVPPETQRWRLAAGLRWGTEVAGWCPRTVQRQRRSLLWSTRVPTHHPHQENTDRRGLE